MVEATAISRQIEFGLPSRGGRALTFGKKMNIGNRWSVKIEEVSACHYRCRAVDRDGRILEIEGSDEGELENRIRIDAYLCDNMVLNKLLLKSLRGRSASLPLDVFTEGYNALDDTDAGWHSFLASLTTLKGMRDELTLVEFRAVEELHESLVSVFPLLLRDVGTQETEHDVHSNTCPPRYQPS